MSNGDVIWWDGHELAEYFYKIEEWKVKGQWNMQPITGRNIKGDVI